MTGIEAGGVAFIGALVAIFFFIVHSSLPKAKDWITEAEEETHRINEMLKSYESFANAAYGIGKTNLHTKPSKPTTYTNVTTGGKKRCAYCGCTNDHIYGTCDYCGAPLEG